MTTMVTGGNGFIGARILRKLVERGQRPVCFDLAPPGAALQPIAGSVDHYRGDVTRLPQLLEAIDAYGVSRVIHMAALLPPDTETRPQLGMQVNIIGTSNVFEAAVYGKLERVVYASSIAVYGTQEPFGERPILEDDLAAPVNVYGMTKLANDVSARAYRERYGLDLRGVRIATVFGHGRVTGMTGLIGGLLVSLPAVGKPVDLPFHPEEKSALIHAEDAAEIFVRVALSDSLRHHVYHSGGHLATVGGMAALVREHLPDARISLGDRFVPHVYLVDNSRMLADVGYELAPLSVRVLDHINDARREAGMAEIGV